MEANDSFDQISPIEHLSFTTIKITSTLNNGHQTSGTGFFYSLFERDGRILPVIVTNKHVVKGAVLGSLLFTISNGNRRPDTTKHHLVNVSDFEAGWYMHPDPAVDLCVYPLNPIIEYAKERGVDLLNCPISREILPTAEQFEELNGLDNVIMVGYPNGFSDTTNNKPIFRKGITATSPRIDYCGKPEFLIDSAVFPGSSGSPVFVADFGTYISKGKLYSGNRIFLIGIAYAVYQHNALGEIVQLPINQVKLNVITGVPNHIGIVIRYDKLLDFEPMFGIHNGKLTVT